MVRRIFSTGPAISCRGREFRGLRGFSGKPLHPPLTDVPVGAYTLTAVFDVISVVAGGGGGVAADAYVAGTWALAAGAVASLGATATGFWDWLRAAPSGTQVWRTANWHMAVMLTVTALVVVDLVLRLGSYDAAAAPVGVAVLSVVIGALTAYGATYGGSLVFEEGFNVESADRSGHAWQKSEEDRYPSQR